MARALAALLGSLAAAPCGAIVIASETRLLRDVEQIRESHAVTSAETQVVDGDMLQHAARRGMEPDEPGCYVKILATSWCSNQELVARYKDWVLQTDPASRRSAHGCRAVGNRLDMWCNLGFGTVQTMFKPGPAPVDVAAADERAESATMKPDAGDENHAEREREAVEKAEARTERLPEPKVEVEAEAKGTAEAEAKRQAEEEMRAEARERQEDELAEAEVAAKAHAETKARATAEAERRAEEAAQAEARRQEELEARKASLEAEKAKLKAQIQAEARRAAAAKAEAKKAEAERKAAQAQAQAAEAAEQRAQAEATKARREAAAKAEAEAEAEAARAKAQAADAAAQRAQEEAKEAGAKAVATGTSCRDQEHEARTAFGKTCSFFSQFPYSCNYAADYYDDGDFTAHDLCCACGGGSGGS